MVNKKSWKIQGIELPWIKRHSKVKVQNNGPKASAAEQQESANMCIWVSNGVILFKTVTPDWSELFRFADLILWNYKTVLLKDRGKKTELSGLKNVKSQIIF